MFLEIHANLYADRTFHGQDLNGGGGGGGDIKLIPPPPSPVKHALKKASLNRVTLLTLDSLACWGSSLYVAVTITFLQLQFVFTVGLRTDKKKHAIH